MVVWHFPQLLPGGVVHHCILQQGPEDKEDTDPGPDVDGLGVGHGGQGVLDAGLGGRHGQQGRHPKRHPGWHLESGKVENGNYKNISLTALWSSQKDIQETETVMEQGT